MFFSPSPSFIQFTKMQTVNKYYDKTNTKFINVDEAKLLGKLMFFKSNLLDSIHLDLLQSGSAESKDISLEDPEGILEQGCGDKSNIL